MMEKHKNIIGFQKGSIPWNRKYHLILTKEYLERKYWEEKLSSTEIGKLSGCSQPAVYYWLKKHGIKIRKNSETTKEYFKRHPESIRRGANNGRWKGGRRIGAWGYVEIYKPGYHKSNNYVYEHRLVMEKKLGRKLKPHEIVHHFDGNKQNNNPDNLFLTIRKKHKVSYANAYKEGFLIGYLFGFCLKILPKEKVSLPGAK